MTLYQLCFCHVNDKFYIYNDQLQRSNASILEAFPVNAHLLFENEIRTESNVKQAQGRMLRLNPSNPRSSVQVQIEVQIQVHLNFADSLRNLSF